MNVAVSSPALRGTMHRIAILIEYPTVNGGENSMLAVLSHLLYSESSSESGLEFHVLGPAEGTMADRVSQLGIPITGLNLFDDAKLAPLPSCTRSEIRVAILIQEATIAFVGLAFDGFIQIVS